MIRGKNIIAVNQCREMLDLLFELDYKIMVAADCIEGIRHTIRYQPDFVLAEINSPHLNGLSMASILNTLLIPTPVILTANEVKYRKHATSFNNVNGFLLNPTKGSGVTPSKIKSDLEAIIFDHDRLSLQQVEYSYHFRQHEWASLLGKSGKKRLLVVEDDPSIRTMILRLLDGAQTYDLFSAADGLDGLFKALLIEPHLILTDISMPTLDGLAMCQVFNILHKQFPLAFITSVTGKENREKALNAHGVLGFLEKSILRDNERFLKEVDRFIHKADHQKTLSAMK